jgi:hypothetical protein
MNLYKLHSKPETLDHHDVAYEKVPKLVWEKYLLNTAELKKREKIFAKDPRTAYEYARFVLLKPFPAGEHAIAKSAEYAFFYADEVIKEPFPAGEAALAKDPWYAYQYARYVLREPWPAGEAAIAKDEIDAYYYALLVLKLPNAEAKKWGRK